MNRTATIRDPPTPQPELFSLYDEEPGGSRPDRMPTLSGPQERVQLRTVQQIVDVAPLPYLDDLMPQMVVQSVEVLQFFLTRWPVAAEQMWDCEVELVIDVPKISSSPRRSRRRRFPWYRRWISWWKCKRPFPFRRCSGLWSRTLASQLLVELELVEVFLVFFLARVPRLWSRSPTLQFLVLVSMEVPKVSIQDRVQQQSQSNSLTFQFRTVAATSKILVSHSFLQKLLEKRYMGFLALFPRQKKVRSKVRTRGWN